jgi:signal transduction histidine kinase
MGVLPARYLPRVGLELSVAAREDLAPTLGLAALGFVEIWLLPSRGPSMAQRVLETAVLFIVAGCFAFRRATPLGVSVLTMVLLTVTTVAVSDSRAWAIAVLILMSYTASRHAGWTGAGLAIALGVLYGAVITSLEGSGGFWMIVGNTLFMLCLMVLVPCAAGLALARRERLGNHDADHAVEEERTRIARELHDVVGHALGVIVVQAEGERAVLTESAADSTRETLAAIAQCARDALDDVRRLLVVMRSAESLGPQPRLSELPRLLESVETAGLRIDLVIEGHPRPLSTAVDLSAYRVVQEALTNTLRHSQGATAHVALRYVDDEVIIDVIDDGPATSDRQSRGFGLLGMRERVALFGGEVQVGTRPGGGFGVHVNLPTGGGARDDASRPRV